MSIISIFEYVILSDATKWHWDKYLPWNILDRSYFGLSNNQADHLGLVRPVGSRLKYFQGVFNGLQALQKFLAACRFQGFMI